MQLVMRVALWILTATVLLEAGCTNTTSGEDKVSFMVFGDPAERNAYLELVDAFHDRYPEIEIEVSHIPSPRDYRTRLVTEFAAGSPPDISLMNYRRYASFAGRDLLEPLGPFMEKSLILEESDFYPAPLEAFTWQGELMCIPQNISSLVIYYNVDLFDSEDLLHPAEGWTWDQFLETAKALTRDFDGDGQIDQYGLGVDPSLFRLAPFVWQNKGQIVDNDLMPGTLTLDRQFSMEALQWFVDLQEKHGVTPGRIEETAFDSESRFVSGQMAMFLNSRRGTPSYREIESFEWDVAALPVGKTRAGILHSDGYCLSRNAEDKDAAWKFIEFANSPEGQIIIARSGRTVPSLIAVAESPAFLDTNLPPKNAQVFLENADIAWKVPVISNWEEIEDIASEEIERAFYGEIGVEEAANLAVQRTEAYFKLAQYAVRP